MDNNKKTMIVHAPEGYEIDEVNSTIREIVFKPIKKTYEHVAKELFEHKELFWVGSFGDIKFKADGAGPSFSEKNNCTSEKQAKKLLAINQIMNVAKYLNNGWTPNWNDTNEAKWYIRVDRENIDTNCVYSINCLDIYFKTSKLAEEAINILGEDVIRLAASTDW